jgi:hypothetical protein
MLIWSKPTVLGLAHGQRAAVPWRSGQQHSASQDRGDARRPPRCRFSSPMTSSWGISASSISPLGIALFSSVLKATYTKFPYDADPEIQGRTAAAADCRRAASPATWEGATAGTPPAPPLHALSFRFQVDPESHPSPLLASSARFSPSNPARSTSNRTDLPLLVPVHQILLGLPRIELI